MGKGRGACSAVILILSLDLWSRYYFLPCPIMLYRDGSDGYMLYVSSQTRLGHVFISCHFTLLALCSSQNELLTVSRTFHDLSSPRAFAYVVHFIWNVLPPLWQSPAYPLCPGSHVNFPCKAFPNPLGVIFCSLWAPSALVHVFS